MQGAAQSAFWGNILSLGFLGDGCPTSDFPVPMSDNVNSGDRKLKFICCQQPNALSELFRRSFRIPGGWPPNRKIVTLNRPFHSLPYPQEESWTAIISSTRIFKKGIILITE